MSIPIGNKNGFLHDDIIYLDCKFPLYQYGRCCRALKEWLLIGTVLLWIPLLKLASLLYVRFNIALPFGLPRQNSKIVLRTVYGLTLVAAIFNIISKYNNGYDPVKLLVLSAGYLFVLVMDYLETEETIKKIEEEKSK